MKTLKFQVHAEAKHNGEVSHFTSHKTQGAALKAKARMEKRFGHEYKNFQIIEK